MKILWSTCLENTSRNIIHRVAAIWFILFCFRVRVSLDGLERTWTHNPLVFPVRPGLQVYTTKPGILWLQQWLQAHICVVPISKWPMEFKSKYLKFSFSPLIISDLCCQSVVKVLLFILVTWSSLGRCPQAGSSEHFSVCCYFLFQLFSAY